MRFTFRDKGLERLYTKRDCAGRPEAVVRGFRKCMQVVDAASDERAFYAMKSLHYEKLSGKRSHQHSMRLNDQWRLILELEGKDANKTVVIVAIEDYH